MQKNILPPKITKFKKQHKGVLTPIEWKHTAVTVTIGLHGLKLLKSFRLNLKQLETIRRIISKKFTKGDRLWFRMIPDIPVSKKPNEIRMGKGKGDIEFWAVRVQAGRTLVEFSTHDPDKPKTIVDLIAKKLPIPCSLIHNTKHTFFLKE
jgi:large subunit ribosomal protein L16